MPENHSDRTHRGDVFMVFPYMDHDMCGLLSNSDFKLSHSVAKLLMRQILQGMDYIHAVSPHLVSASGGTELTRSSEQLHPSGYQDCQYSGGSRRRHQDCRFRSSADVDIRQEDAQASGYRIYQYGGHKMVSSSRTPAWGSALWPSRRYVVYRVSSVWSIRLTVSETEADYQMRPG